MKATQRCPAVAPANAGRRALVLRSVRPHFGFPLRVFQIPKLCGNSAGNSRSLAAGLETGEIGAVAPGEWAAQPLASGESGVMENVDEPFVIVIALFIA